MLLLLLLVGLIFLIPSNSNAFWGNKTYEECILENMPGIEGRQAAITVRMSCQQKYPKRAEPKRRLGVFGPSNFDDCILKYITGKERDEAASFIRQACSSLLPRRR